MQKQKERLQLIESYLSKFRSSSSSYVSSRRRREYTTRKDKEVEILKTATNNILKLNEVKKELEKNIENFILLAESKVGMYRGESISMHPINYVWVEDLTSGELSAIAELNKNVEKELTLQRGIDYFNNYHDFELEM